MSTNKFSCITIHKVISLCSLLKLAKPCCRPEGFLWTPLNPWGIAMYIVSCRVQMAFSSELTFSTELSLTNLFLHTFFTVLLAPGVCSKEAPACRADNPQLRLTHHCTEPLPKKELRSWGGKRSWSDLRLLSSRHPPVASPPFDKKKVKDILVAIK